MEFFFLLIQLLAFLSGFFIRQSSLGYVTYPLMELEDPDYKFILKMDKDILVKKKFLITIAISIYNKKHYLERCLISCLRQTDPNYQIVFIDDGSTDGSFDYLVNKAKFDPRVTIVKHIYNKGLIHARISGVKNSDGMYILSYDPDDVLYPDSIKGLHHYIKKYNYSADVLEFIQDAQFMPKMVKNYVKCKKNYKNNPNELVRVYSTFRKMSHNVCKRLIRRDIYLKALDIIYPFVKGKHYIYCEDRLQVATVFALTSKFYCVNVEVYLYFIQNPDGSKTESYQSMVQTRKQTIYADNYIGYINNAAMIAKIQKGENLFRDFIKKNKNLYDEITNITVENKPINLTFASKYYKIKTEEEGVVVLNKFIDQ